MVRHTERGINTALFYVEEGEQLDVTFGGEDPVVVSGTATEVTKEQPEGTEVLEIGVTLEGDNGGTYTLEATRASTSSDDRNENPEDVVAVNRPESSSLPEELLDNTLEEVDDGTASQVREEFQKAREELRQARDEVDTHLATLDRYLEGEITLGEYERRLDMMTLEAGGTLAISDLP